MISSFSMAHAQNSVIDEFGSSVIVTQPSEDISNNKLTLSVLVNCLENEYMPNDPDGQNRQVSFAGNARNFMVILQNNGAKLVFHLSPSSNETLLTAISTGLQQDRDSEMTYKDYVDGIHIIDYQLSDLLQSCPALQNH